MEHMSLTSIKRQLFSWAACGEGCLIGRVSEGSQDAVHFEACACEAPKASRVRS